MANITGTTGDDIIDNTTTGNDTVDALAGYDTIYGSSGTDTIDGGLDSGELIYFLSDSSYFNTVSGPRTFTITDSSVTDSSGDIVTTMANIEYVRINTVGLPLLPAGQGYTFNASAFTGWRGVAFDVFGTADTLIGSDQDDYFSVRGSQVDVTGGAGDDWLDIGLIWGGAETATFTVDVSGDIVMTANGGDSVTFREIESISIYRSFGGGKTVDWSATSVGMFWEGYGDALSAELDTITAGSGNDGIGFNYGNDILTSGDGIDIFFAATMWDPINSVGAAFDGATITDFALDDILIIGEPYTFIRTEAFSGTAGEIRYENVSGTTIIQSDGDGDGSADATLTLSNGEFTLRDGVGYLPIPLEPIPLYGIQIVPLIEGTSGDDQIVPSFPGALAVSELDDHVDAKAGYDWIVGTAGHDFIDGGDDFDWLFFAPSPYSGLFNLPEGQRTFVIGASSVTDDTGTVNTTFTNIETIEFEMRGLSFGGGHTLDASGFTGAGVTVRTEAADTIIGSNQSDDFWVGPGSADITGGGGYDVVFASLFPVFNTGSGPYTNSGSINFATSGSDVVVSTSDGTSITVRGIEELFFQKEAPGSQRHIYGAALNIPIYWLDSDDEFSFDMDFINGGLQNDVISIGVGGGEYSGGGGNDTFSIDWLGAWDESIGAATQILDFALGDTINLVGSFYGLDVYGDFITGPFTGVAGQVRSFNFGTHTTLVADLDGDSTGDVSLYITNGGFDLVETYAGSNVLWIGPAVSTSPTTGDDVITGTPNQDTIDALAGNDRVEGLEDDDELHGGADNDVLSGDFDEFSNLGGDDDLFGDAGNDVLIGGKGNDTLSGGDDDDRLIGGPGIVYGFFGGGWSAGGYVLTDAGNDSYDGGAGFDTALLSFYRPETISLDMSNPAALNPILSDGIQVGTITNVERLEYYGGIGDSDIVGGPNDDFFASGTGDDAFDGGPGIDTVWYYYAPGGVNVDLRIVAPQNTGTGSLEPVGGLGNTTGLEPAGGTLAGNGQVVYHQATPSAEGDPPVQGANTPDPLQRSDILLPEDQANIPFQDTVSAGFDTLASIENLTGSQYDDTLIGNDLVNVISGVGGNDIIQGQGGDDQFLHGGDGHDAIFGDSDSTDILNPGPIGDDYLVGGADNDFLVGGLGYDVLIGEDGDDILISGLGRAISVSASGGWSFGWNPNIDGGDVEIDGGIGNDHAIVAMPRAQAIVYDGSDTALSNTITVGGVWAGVITSAEELDFYSGNGDDDITLGGTYGSVVGAGGNDRLVGKALYYNDFAPGAGDDEVIGLTGETTVDYGWGYEHNGTFYIAPPAGVTVDLTIVGIAQNTVGAGWDTLSGVRHLRGTNWADTLTGNDEANNLNGNGGDDTLSGGLGGDLLSGDLGDDTLFGENGHDWLYGGEDNDTLDGGPGNDMLNGGTGIDTASYASATGGVTVYLTTLGAQNTAGAGNDTLAEIENLIGSVFGDNLNGDSGANTISGGTGPDTIAGQAGDDVLNGDSGRDVLRGGPGNDVINGGNGRDQLFGGADDDTLDGGSGNDSLTGGSGIDTASYASATGGVTVFLTNLGAQNTFGAGIDTLSGIENLTGSDYGDTLSGDSGANAIAGGAGPDTIVGQAGDDVLNGDGGRDELRGGSGNDVLNGGLGIDELTGGLDADRFVFDDPTHTEVADPDTILDFDELAGDRIDLSAIDAIAGGADDPFTFVAGGAFNSTAGALIVVNHAAGQYRVEGDINGDNLADFAIIVTATAMPTVGAFIV